MASFAMDAVNEDVVHEQERRAQVKQLLEDFAEDTAAKLALPPNSQNAHWQYHQFRTKLGLAAVGLAMGNVVAAMQALGFTTPAAPHPDLVALTRDRSAQLPTPAPAAVQEAVPSLGK
jgi:hypothetical protein